MTSSGMAAEAEPPRSGELLTFALDNETFAVEVERVREVVDLGPATDVPNAPDHAPSVINVRGNVVPLVELRARFGMPPLVDRRGDVRVVVTEVAIGGEPTLVGIKADAVYKVIDAGRSALDELPRLGTRWPPEFIRGVVRQEGGFVIVLDIGRVLAGTAPARDPTI